MGSENQKDKGKLFSENIDNLLDGNQPAPDASMEEDERESLNIARRMIASAPRPNPVFEARLKSKLLQKLAENEEKNRTRSWRSILRQPVWQAAAATLALIVIAGTAVLVGELNHRETLVTSVRTTSTTTTTYATTTTSTTIMTTMTASGQSSAASMSPAAGGALLINANTNKSNYAPGEPVQIQVSLRNVTALPVRLEQYPPILSVMQTESRQPVYTFRGGDLSKTLEPNEMVTFSEYWTQYGANGVPATGDFYLELEDMDYLAGSLKLTLAKPVTFTIQATAGNIGAVYQTINLNQSQTVNGITVVLQKLELSANGGRMTAFVSAPPGYNDNPASRDFTAFATYYIDDGWVNNAGLSSVEYRPSDMKHTWYLSEPVPPDAKQMLFVITNVGSFKGPWQFNVSLGR